MALIQTFIPRVVEGLGNRTDINEKITNWLYDAYIEIAFAFPLETLEQSVDIIFASDQQPYPADARAVKALTVQGPTGPIELKKRNINVIRKYQTTVTGASGIPAIWAPFGQNVIVRPVPDRAYTGIMDYWRKPVINAADPNAPTTEEKNLTLVELPDDWFEILVFEATERGHNKLNEFDKAAAVHQTLHGDPNPSKGQPGLIKERTTRNGAENALSDFGLRPRMTTRRYTS